MQDYFISFMTVEDLNKIKNILQSDFDEFWDYDVLYNELISANSKYIVAKTKDNIIVAFAGIKIILDTAEIMNIVTKKSMRNLGIGSYMLENLISICKKNNIKLLNLEVKNTNSIAINLYKKYNFREVGLRKKYYDNKDDAILMSLNL
jgi:ribosomal-protein-alanine N-acetyltransferase